MRDLNGITSTLIIFFNLLILWPNRAWAETLPAPYANLIEIHSFVNQGYIYSTKNTYLIPASQNGQMAFTEIGINITKQLSNTFRTGLQFYASNTQSSTSNNDFNVKVDWFYGDFYWKELASFRFGRLKIPFGLYNEFNDVDSGRTSILLPQSVYPLMNRSFLLAQSGIEVYGNFNLINWGALEYRLYSGTIDIDIPPSNENRTIHQIDVPYLYGGRLIWETPINGLRLGASLQKLQINYEHTSGGIPTSTKLPATLALASAEYTQNDLLAAFEYGQWEVETKSKNSEVVPDSKRIQERFYTMLTYRVNNLLHPGFYYSIHHPDIGEKNEKENYLRDLALFVRFDLKPYWLIKISGHHMEGTASLQPEINDNKPIQELEKSWQVLLIKTTAYF